MNANNRSEKEIVTQIKIGDPERSQVLRYLFEQLDWKGAVYGLLLDKGADMNDAKEIAILALQLFDHNIRKDDFEQRSALKTYFLSIAKFQWYKMLRGRKKHDEYDPKKDERQETNIEDSILDGDRMMYLEQATGVLGKGCQDIFRLKGLGLKNEVIAIRIGLANADQVKKKHARCRKRFADYLIKNPQWKDLLNR